jgi:hypothetical protein
MNQQEAAAEVTRWLAALHTRLAEAGEAALAVYDDPNTMTGDLAFRRAAILADAVADCKGSLHWLLNSPGSPLPVALSGGAS